MSKETREAFVAEVHVGVFTVARGDGVPPLATPVWYSYEPGGDVLLNIAGGGEKARLLTSAPVASLCVQSESLPYKFVTVGGDVTTGPDDEALRRRIAERYLPAELVDGYLASSESADMLTVRLTPRSWHSNDYSNITL